MPNENEIYNIVLQVQGDERARKLAAEIEAAEKQLVKMITTLQKFGASEADIHQHTIKQATLVANLRNEYASLERSMTSASGPKNMGNALTQLGYSIDDAQYGMKGLTNNIQPLVQSFGAGAGLAGAIGISVIAITQLATHWDDLMDLFGMGRVKSQAEQMADLAKATEKTAAETEKLLKYETQKATIKSQRESRTPQQTTQASMVNAAIAEAGDDKVVRGLAQLMQANSPRMKKIDDQQSREEFMIRSAGRTPSQGFYDRFDAQRNKLAGQQDTASRKMMADAANDPAALKRLTEAIITNKGAFGPGADKLALKLLMASPENQAANEENQKIGDKADEARAEKQRNENAAAAKQTTIERWRADQQQEADRQGRRDKAEMDKGQAGNAAQFERLGGSADLATSAGGMLQKYSARDVVVGITNRLTESMGAERAKSFAETAVDQARAKAMRGQTDKPRIANSQTMDAASLASYYQSAVSNRDPAQDQVRQLADANKNLREILAETRRANRNPRPAVVE